MNKVFLSLSIFLSTVVFGQLSGEVSYITKRDMHRNLPNDERGDRMRSFMPEFVEFQNQLLFTDSVTLYKNVVEEEEEAVDLDQQDRRKRRMMKRMAPASDIVYCNAAEGLVVEKKEFMDKVFLIRDTLDISKWKLTGEQKEVSGMNCMKAEFIPDEGDSTSVEVWFTPEIPVSSGPAGYGGLPGLIVFVDVNEGEEQISLSTIVMREIAEGEIEEPTKGKEVTREEFHEMRKKKMEQMRQQRESSDRPPGPPRH